MPGPMKFRLEPDGTAIHETRNEIERIEEVWAYVSKDEGGEGICSVILPTLGSTPLVYAQPRLHDMMRQLATELATRTGTKVRHVRFTRRKDLGVIDGEALRRKP